MRRTSQFLIRLMAVLLLSSFTMPALVAAAQTPGQPIAEPTGTELAYLAATQPFRERFGAYRDLLAAHLKLAADGKLDEIALTDLGNLTKELFLARKAFNETGPSVRLDMYDRTIKLALDRAYESASLLLRAQVTESEGDHLTLIRRATEYGTNSQRLFQEATDELRTVLPMMTDERFRTQ